MESGVQHSIGVYILVTNATEAGELFANAKRNGHLFTVCDGRKLKESNDQEPVQSDPKSHAKTHVGNNENDN